MEKLKLPMSSPKSQSANTPRPRSSKRWAPGSNRVTHLVLIPQPAPIRSITSIRRNGDPFNKPGDAQNWVAIDTGKVAVGSRLPRRPKGLYDSAPGATLGNIEGR